MQFRDVTAPPETDDQRRLTDRKRASIVRAAAAEFQANGFDGTSMDQIATRARVSKRTVYNHFSSKEDLFREIIAELSERSRPTDSFAFDRERTVEQQLNEIGSIVIDTMSGEDFIKLARVVLSHFMQRPGLAREAIGGGQKPFRAGLTEWVRAAGRDGKLSVADADLAARQFVALVSATAFWPQVLAGRPPLSLAARDELLRETVSMFLDHYAR